MTIRGDKRVGIGTTNPAQSLHVVGNGTFTNSLAIGNTAPAERLHVKQMIANAAIRWVHESTNDFWTVGIGTNTLNARFQFNNNDMGQISSVDGSYSQISDSRLKQDIEPVRQALDKVMQLKPSLYYYKVGRAQAKNKSLGFVAQEVEKVFPELVYEDDNGYKLLNYSGFAVLAVKAVQEQQAQITQLQEQVTEQSRQIEELKELVNRLTKDRGTPGALSRTLLSQNTPNPVRGSTRIYYSLPEGASRAQLLVTDNLGRTVRTVQLSGAGTLNLDVSTLAAGVYTYSLVVDDKILRTNKMTVGR